MTSVSSMHEAGYPSQCSGTTKRDTVGGKREGVSGGGHMYTCGRFMLMDYGKNHHNIVKYLSSN